MVITDVNQVVYRGDGSNTAFPFTFKIQDASEINLQLVYADGTVTDITSDFYVDMINNIVYYPGYAPGAEPPAEDQPPVLAVGQKLVVYRELPVTQESDLGDKWPFFVIELALDKLTMLIQQIKGWYERSLHISVGTSADHPDIDLTVPIEAGKTFRVNEEGTGLEVCDTPSVAMEKAEAAQAAAEAAQEEVENELATLHEQLNAFLNEHSDGVMQFDENFDIEPCEFPIGNDLWDVNPDGSLTPIQ